MKPFFEILEACTSTNTLMSSRTDVPHGSVLAARMQSQGRGQRGNSWESEPGCNLTFSLMLRPEALPAARQFELSMVVSLAIADAIDALLPPGVQTTVKWPNDIYIGLGKVCGILIENKLRGTHIDSSIVGAGINVNQRDFISDAPNPVSIIHYNGGLKTDLDSFLRDVTHRITSDWDAYSTAPDPDALSARYFARLLWTSGDHPFRDAAGHTFHSHITAVASDGTLTLANGRTFLFKEVSFIIP
ncbi:MAG: biotin--[acetyl-CoA-carboxylase] ligase [Muribaculaceae bacterium]|nr:biotin--[acetyl-CoA-carboxylase] ligase [Muribaculaceae bacterium]